jgi:hypothetical protein
MSETQERTHCQKGHKFTPENTYLRKGKIPGTFYKRCRQCYTIQTIARRRKNNTAVIPKSTKKPEIFGRDCMTLAEYKLYRGVDWPMVSSFLFLALLVILAMLSAKAIFALFVGAGVPKHDCMSEENLAEFSDGKNYGKICRVCLDIKYDKN